MECPTFPLAPWLSPPPAASTSSPAEPPARRRRPRRRRRRRRGWRRPPRSSLRRGLSWDEHVEKTWENVEKTMDETQWKMMDQHEKHGVQRWLNQEKWWTKPKLVVQQRKMLALWSFCGGSIWFHQPTWRTKRDKTNKHGDVNRVMLI